MKQPKGHLEVSQFCQPELFKSKNGGASKQIVQKQRAIHGNALLRQYQELLTQYESAQLTPKVPITEDKGIYVEIIGDSELPLNSLDNTTFRLCSCKKQGDSDIALVFIPEDKRSVFLKKIEDYLNPEKDAKPNKDNIRNPRNYTLLNSISQIRLAKTESFWTDSKDAFPKDTTQKIWWELWLKTRAGESPQDIAQALANRLGARLGNTATSFFDSYVVLIETSAEQLSTAPELIANLDELRMAKETPTPILESSPYDQQQWLGSAAENISVNEHANTSVTILDTGVNYHHPLLQQVCNQSSTETWSPDWPDYDEFFPLAPFNDHGSLQAGLASFGDMMEVVLGDTYLELHHRIESARILPPTGQNDPDLYGAVTTGTALKLEIDQAHVNRVYSLAVTSAQENQSGHPSSWSAAIDQFCSGFDDDIHRLFVISAGNNIEINPQIDYWDQVTLAPIEDPAQSWNALTVGAFTEKTTNDDPDFQGWAPFSLYGDVSPASRSSQSWTWKKQAPIKPDVVAEGGNRLISPDRTQVSNEDVVGLLTTSGRTAGQMFERAGDTSAACALVSRQAAILMAEYPHYWPETIRGLLVHSAKWTEQMRERHRAISKTSKPKVAIENLLRTVGYGVTDLERSLYSASNALTLIAQSQIQPFYKKHDAAASSDPVFHEMNLHQLPWPKEALQLLPGDINVKLRVTLSYFVEPNPRRRGFRTRYSYQSHGLRFDVIRPRESVNTFRAALNKFAVDENYDGREGDKDGWVVGSKLRTRGSIHSDIWEGSAADLRDMHTIAVFPVSGWWKYKSAGERWQNAVRYSLLVSIDVADTDIDIYTEVENSINIAIEV